MFLSRRKKLSSLCLVVVTAFLPTPSLAQAATFQSPQHHYSFSVPDDWKQVSQSAIDDLNKCLSGNRLFFVREVMRDGVNSVEDVIEGTISCFI